MPITPSHLGAGLFLGLFSLRFLNLWGLLLGSVVVDLENVFWTIVNVLNNCHRCFHHGFFHSILGATVGSLILALLLQKFAEPLKKISLRFKIEQPFSFSALFFGSLVGWLIHIILDSFVHRDVFLFWPIKTNPFLIHRTLYWPLSWVLGAFGLVSLFLFVVKYLKKHD